MKCSHASLTISTIYFLTVSTAIELYLQYIFFLFIWGWVENGVQKGGGTAQGRNVWWSSAISGKRHFERIFTRSEKGSKRGFKVWYRFLVWLMVEDIYPTAVYARSVSLLAYPMVVYARSMSLLAYPTVVYAASDTGVAYPAVVYARSILLLVYPTAK